MGQIFLFGLIVEDLENQMDMLGLAISSGESDIVAGFNLGTGWKLSSRPAFPC